jgi:hypothetical protein
VRKKLQCKFCPRQIAACGMPAHVHFKHLGAYMDNVRPILAWYLAGIPDPTRLLTA